MDSLETSVFINAVVQKINGLRDLISEFRADTARNVSDHFLNGVEAVVAAVERFHQNRMQHTDANSTDDLDFREEQKQFYCKICLQLLVNIHERYLPLLYASRHHNEYLILPSINRGISLFKSGVELTLLPSFTFNYSFDSGLESFVEKAIETLEKYLDKESQGTVRSVLQNAVHPQWITFIHFPLVERDSALHLVIITHEVGHLIDQVTGFYKRFFPFQLEKSSFTKELDELCNMLMPNPIAGPNSSQLTLGAVWGRANLEAEFTKNCIAAGESWIREIIADAMAIHTIGPAFLFSLGHLSVHGENEPSNTHPSVLYRMHLLLVELEYLGYLKEAGALRKSLGDLSSKVESSLPGVAYKGVFAVAQKTIEKIVPGIQAAVRTLMRDYSYTFGKYQLEVPKVVEALLKGISPIELDTSCLASVPAILNGGWELYTTKLPEFYSLFRDNISEYDRVRILNQLLFKAIEAGEVARLWKQASTR